MHWHFPSGTPDWWKFIIITNSKITPEFGVDKGDTAFLICLSIILILASCWWQQARQDYFDDAPRRSHLIRQKEEEKQARKERWQAEAAWKRGEIVDKRKIESKGGRQMVVEN